MAEAYIYDAVRTPRGKFRGGALTEISPIELAATPLRALKDRNGLDTTHIDDVLLGCVAAVGEQGTDIARPAVMAAGYGDHVPGLQLSRFCASGLDAVNMAFAQVASGQADLMVAGGVESMSRVGMGADRGSLSSDPKVTLEMGYIPQGIAADLIATLGGQSRADVDAFAVASQARAARAWQDGYFVRSIVPVRDIAGTVVLDRDQHMKPNTTLQTLGALEAAFAKMGKTGSDAIALKRYPHLEAIEHVHHAGNSSGVVDGAAAVLIGSAEMGARQGLKPRARLRAFASGGSEPTIMLTGPGPVTRKALARAGMTFNDIDLFEVNEAFSSVVLRFMAECDVDHDRVNVNGGAIAMGHPLGATGAMLIGTLIDELERRGKGVGLVTLCAAAGMATSTIIELV